MSIDSRLKLISNENPLRVFNFAKDKILDYVNKDSSRFYGVDKISKVLSIRRDLVEKVVFNSFEFRKCYFPLKNKDFALKDKPLDFYERIYKILAED